MHASFVDAASANLTSIPPATQIVDGSGNTWTLANGLVYENGKLGGYTANVALLLYDNGTVYHQNTAGLWWSWDGTAWIASSDPRGTASVTGTSIPPATQIIDSVGNTWTVAHGVVYEDGKTAGYSSNVALLLYSSNVIYHENTTGSWYAWAGTSWKKTSDPRVPPTSGTAIPPATQIIDSSGNTWTVSAGVVLENGASAGYTANVALLLYQGGVFYHQNTAGLWWSWNGRTWQASSDPRRSVSLSWTTPTKNSDGTSLTTLAGYTISYGTSPSALTQTIRVADPTATSYTVPSLASGTYYFVVSAYTSDGTKGLPSSAVTKTVP